MKTEGLLNAILEKRRQGFSFSEIATIVGVSERTARKYVKNPLVERQRKITAFIPFIELMIKSSPEQSCRKIFSSLWDHGYTGGLTAVIEETKCARVRLLAEKVLTPPAR